MRQGGAFAGRADWNEPVRPADDLPIDQRAVPVLIETPIMERRDERG